MTDQHDVRIWKTKSGGRVKLIRDNYLPSDITMVVESNDGVKKADILLTWEEVGYLARVWDEWRKPKKPDLSNLDGVLTYLDELEKRLDGALVEDKHGAELGKIRAGLVNASVALRQLLERSDGSNAECLEATRKRLVAFSDRVLEADQGGRQ